MIVDRRGFLRGAGAAAVAGLGGRQVGAMRLGFVASGQDAVHVFAAEGAEWGLRGRVETRSPRALVLSRDRRILYVGNAVEEFGGRPTGSVEAYAVDWVSGTLRVVNRAGLALFATRPESLAASPNGRWLAVGLAAGLGCNLLSLGVDGSVRGVTASLRRVGVRAAEGEVRVEFLDDATLVAMEGSVMTVGEDGSLRLSDGGGGRRSAGVCEAERRLGRAAAEAGIEEPRAMIVG